MEANRLVPKLRFSEFGDKFNKRVLGDLTNNISSGKSKCEESGGFDVYGSTGIIGVSSNYSHKGKYLLVARVGANAGFINYVDGCFGVTDNTLVVDLKDGVNINFILNYLLSYNLNRLVFGSGQPLITGGILKKVKLNIPLISEQNKIASFLTSVDKKINLLTKKKALLESYKKGVMQKIFSQEIRFKDEDGKDFPDWEEKQLGKILSIASGRDYKNLGKGDIPVYGTGGLMTRVDKYLYEGDSVGIGRKGTIDRPVMLRGKFWTVDTLFYTHNFINSIPKFVFYLFQRIDWYRYNEASGVPSLSKKTIEKILKPFPSCCEQYKIAEFLSIIDKKIELVDFQLERNKEFKKGLLQQMFV
ncbi:restriction endonuclease subunit S [Flavobacteriaceae bacterium]|nr:restriction endonuclease subunit S [Flavobacteriaceae bacterium]